MGRPKSYNRREVAAKAMDLFWRRGFHATSTKDLADTMGVNSYSLFAEFGSKQGLYEAALELYEQEVVSRYFGRLESPEAGMKELVEIIEFFASSIGTPGSERGCLLCNMATERAPTDPVTGEFVERYVGRIQRAIHNALENAKARGELGAGISCADESELLTSTLLGFWVQMRAGVDREHTLGAARAVRRNLERLLA